MNDFLKRYKVDIFSWLGLILVYFITRLVNLGAIPIFTDEAIYLRWSQIMASDAALRYLPLVDGKPPLFMWLTSIVIKILPRLDVLLTGRLVSVAAGLGGMIGIYFASYQLFHNKKISYLSSLFYLLSSFTLFYDRFGLADSLLAMFGIWSLGLGVLLVKKIRLDVAMILGITIGLGRLTKTPALFFLACLPLLFLLVNFKNKRWKLNLLKIGGLFILAAVFSEAIYSILRLFPLFNMISQKNLEFSVSASEFLRQPLTYFARNLPELISWEVGYLTAPVAIVALVGTIFGLKKHFRETIILVGYFGAALAYMAFLNKVIYPRFLLPFTPVLLILSTVGLFEIFQKAGRKLLLSAFIALAVYSLPVYTDFQLLRDSVSAPLLQADRDQYLDGWPAGFGAKEVRNFLTEQSQLNSKVFVGTEGTFGLMPYALELYQKDYPNVEIKPYWPVSSKVPIEMSEAAKKYPTYFLMYQSQTVPNGWKLEEILRFRQGLGTDYLRLYKVLP